MGAPFDVVLTLVVSFLLRSFVYDCQKDFFFCYCIFVWLYQVILASEEEFGNVYSF